MNLIKKALLTFSIAISLGASTVALAAEPAPRAVAHLEQAIAEIAKHDFNAAYIHEKAARGASDEIEGHKDAVNQGIACIINAQKAGKNADAETAVAEINKAIGFYKSI